LVEGFDSHNVHRMLRTVTIARRIEHRYYRVLGTQG
jgi:hypothetical protein